MGKYMRKSKNAGVLDVSHAQSSIGVRTRAKTLYLQRLQISSSAASPPMTEISGRSYLQLRTRRLEKRPILLAPSVSKRRKNTAKRSLCSNPSPNPSAQKSGSRASLRLRAVSLNSGSGGSVSLNCLNREKGCSDAEKTVGPAGEDNQGNDNKESGGDVGIEASFGENVLEFEGRERGSRESTPCSLIRDPDAIRTPGSTTKATSLSGRVRNPMLRHIPTALEMDEFFSVEEKKQQAEFVDKYNFDPAKEEPLPGRYEWVKIDP